jgi:hypothetical protein
LNDNLCEKLPPAYTWRDYSAIIYLNNDFEGGEFIFAADSNAAQIQVHRSGPRFCKIKSTTVFKSVVQPKCGRMIAFSSGSENLHGVKAVKKGSRCAIGVWFTFDPEHEETERITARQVVELFQTKDLKE